VADLYKQQLARPSAGQPVAVFWTCVFLSLVMTERQDDYSSPNFRAAISCISSREMVPYMSMVVW
jgi:hypothetical protein